MTERVRPHRMDRWGVRPWRDSLADRLARTRHVTDIPALGVLAAGLAFVLGGPAFGLVALAGGAAWSAGPALARRLADANGRYATPTRRILIWTLTVDLPRAGMVAGLLGYAAWTAGFATVAAILSAAGAVYVLPRLLLPGLVAPRVAPLRPRPRSLLLQRSDVLGDFVLGTPVLRAIHATDPDTRVTWLCRATNADLIGGHPFARDVLVDPTARGPSARARAWLPGWCVLVRRLASRRFDAIVSLWDRPTLVYHAAAWRTGIGVRAGNVLAERTGWLCNAGPRLEPDPMLHEVERNLAVVAALGYRTDGAPSLWIAPAPETAHRAEALLRARGVGNGETFVALSPATSGVNRRLEPATYAAVVDHVRRRYGVPAVLLGGQSDKPLTTAIQRLSSSAPIDLAGETTTGMLAAILARCRLHIGCDSGPAHVAAAVNAPSVVISPAKSQKPLNWAPWMAPHRIVRARARCPLTCRPLSCRADTCVRAIGVDRICAAIDAVWRGDSAVEPRDGRRSWAVVSLSPVIHTSAPETPDVPLRLLGHLRDAGFMEFALACPPEAPLFRAAAAGGFDVRGVDLASLIDVLVEFDGGPVWDLDVTPTPALRLALAIARPRCSRFGARRVAIAGPITSAGHAVDGLLGAMRLGGRA